MLLLLHVSLPSTQPKIYEGGHDIPRIINHEDINVLVDTIIFASSLHHSYNESVLPLNFLFFNFGESVLNDYLLGYFPPTTYMLCQPLFVIDHHVGAMNGNGWWYVQVTSYLEHPIWVVEIISIEYETMSLEITIFHGFTIMIHVKVIPINPFNLQVLLQFVGPPLYMEVLD